MQDQIDLLLADAASQLLASLNGTGSQKTRDFGLLSRDSTAIEHGRLSRTILGSLIATRLDSGNFIALNPMKQAADAWMVLVPLEFQRKSGFIEFRVRGILRTAHDPATFITESYLYILNRSADAEGMTTYMSGFENGTLTHSEMLLTLASSAEAGQQYERLLIYPVPDDDERDGAQREPDHFLVATEILSEPLA